MDASQKPGTAWGPDRWGRPGCLLGSLLSMTRSGLAWILLTLSLGIGLPNMLMAEQLPLRLGVVASGNAPLDSRVVQLLTASLPFPVEIELAAEPEADVDITLALGPLALTKTLAAPRRTPVLALFVNSDVFDHMRQAHEERPPGTLSALHYDAPMARQALLGRVLIPSAQRVAVLDSVERGVVGPQDLEALGKLGLMPEIFHMQSAAELIAVLNRALDYGDFLLGTPNQSVYNRNTIKHLLLTAYRRNRFLIGPSRAFVQAGALASTYTTLDQFANQAAQFLVHFKETGNLPEARFSSEFEIALNAQVARSLNLALPGEAQLKARLNALEASRTGDSRESSP